MSKNNNTIKINGKRYDAKTGDLLDSSSPMTAKTKIKPAAESARPGPKASKPVLRDAARQPVKRSSSRAPAPSRTLMRQAVKKPGTSLKRRHKAQGDTDALALRRLSEVIVKPSALSLDEQRLQHAKQIPRSRLISRFPSVTSDAFSPAPQTAKPVRQTDTARGHDGSRPAAGQPDRSIKRPKTTADMLDRALERATSHLEPPVSHIKSRRHDRLKRNTGIGAAIGLSVLLLGVIVTQNTGNVRLQMASAKAGFNVSLPNYHPAGYDLGQLNYSQGVAAAQFNSNSNGGHYTITQKSSSWDSSALRDNFITPSYDQYKTASADGLTIYIYADNDATWVNGGIWYVIQSNGSLNNRQLVSLATSL